MLNEALSSVIWLEMFAASALVFQLTNAVDADPNSKQAMVTFWPTSNIGKLGSTWVVIKPTGQKQNICIVPYLFIRVNNAADSH